MGNALAVSKPKQRRQPHQPENDDDVDRCHRHRPPQPHEHCASSSSRRKTLSPSPRPFRRPLRPSSCTPHPRPSPTRRSRSPSEGVTSDCSSMATTTATATESHGTRRSGAAAARRHCGRARSNETRRTLRGRSVRDAMQSVAATDGHRAVAAADPTDRVQTHDTDKAAAAAADEQQQQQRRRIQQAETILLEIAKEFAAKRAAGLVPMKPVPARTLLWQEMERRAQRVRSRVGRRGTCVFGRDTDAGPCGCATYRTSGTALAEAGGAVCACCGHGAPWHRLAGGTMAATDSSGSTTVSQRSRGTGRASTRARKSPGPSRNSCCAAAASRRASGEALQWTPTDASVCSLGSDYYDEFDGEYSAEESDDEDDDESDDEDDVANEVARPHGMMMDDLAPPLVRSHARSEGDTLDRSSLFSNGDSFGLPPRLSSTSRHLDKLLGAIAKYRTMGLSEAAIEATIRRDFPPTERLAHDGKRSSSTTSRPTRASQ